MFADSSEGLLCHFSCEEKWCARFSTGSERKLSFWRYNDICVARLTCSWCPPTRRKSAEIRSILGVCLASCALSQHGLPGRIPCGFSLVGIFDWHGVWRAKKVLFFLCCLQNSLLPVLFEFLLQGPSAAGISWQWLMWCASKSWWLSEYIPSFFVWSWGVFHTGLHHIQH